MEKQNKLVIEILRRLDDAGILPNILLIGSWCASFYKAYFKGVDYNPRIRTRDIDFLLNIRPAFQKACDIETLMAPLGFEVGFYGKGYMKLESEDLALEFIIPEVGPHKEKPHAVPDLKFNAQPLRHTAMLWRKPVEVTIEGIRVRLPHPADFCIQKLVIVSKRKAAEKAEKDRASALEVLDVLIKKGQQSEIENAISKLTESERKSVVGELKRSGYELL